MLQRLLHVQHVLKKLVVDQGWDAYVLGLPTATRESAQQVMQLVLGVGVHKRFWDHATALVSICKPVLALLRLTDSDQPTLSKLYHKSHTMQEAALAAAEASGLPKEEVISIRAHVARRIGKMITPLHRAAAAVDPEYHSLLASPMFARALVDFNDIASRLVPLKETEVVMQVVEYQRKEGQSFASGQAWVQAQSMPAHKWWSAYGNSTPELRDLAIKLTAQPTSACSCERGWSTFDFIHSKRRNRLDATRAADLVFVFSNLRVLQSQTGGTRRAAALALEVDPAAVPEQEVEAASDDVSEDGYAVLAHDD